MASIASNAQWGSSPTIYFDFSYEKRREGSTQYYQITVSSDPITGASYFGYPIYVEISLDGAVKASYTLKNASPSQWSSAISNTTGWLAVSNKTSGTTALSIRLYSGSGSTRDTRYNYTLAIDPAASTISCTTADIESNPTITISRASSNFRHTITYAFGSLTGAIATKTSATKITNWTIPASFYAQIPNEKTGKGTLTCATYNGNTLIGEATCPLNVSTNEAKCKPVVSVVAVDTNDDIVSLTGNNKVIVKGFSDVEVTTTAEGQNSAKVSSVAVTCGSAKKTGTTVTFNDAESATIEATATDSREYSSKAKASGLSLVNYIVPTIVETVSRESPTSNTVNIYAEGRWFNGNFGAVQNSLRVQVRYKLKSQSAYEDTDKYVDMTVTTDGNTYKATASLPGLLYTQSYSIRIRVSDAIHEYDGPIAEAIYKNTEISKGIPVFDWGENDFRFNVPVFLGDDACAVGAFGQGVKVWYGSVTMVPAGANAITSEVIDLPSGYFTETPYVFVAPRSTVPGEWHCSHMATKDEITVYFVRADTVETLVSVFAIGK